MINAFGKASVVAVGERSSDRPGQGLRLSLFRGTVGGPILTQMIAVGWLALIVSWTSRPSVSLGGGRLP